jgi:hypothetical protein
MNDSQDMNDTEQDALDAAWEAYRRAHDHEYDDYLILAEDCIDDQLGIYPSEELLSYVRNAIDMAIREVLAGAQPDKQRFVDEMEPFTGELRP